MYFMLEKAVFYEGSKEQRWAGCSIIIRYCASENDGRKERRT